MRCCFQIYFQMCVRKTDINSALDEVEVYFYLLAFGRLVLQSWYGGSAPYTHLDPPSSDCRRGCLKTLVPLPKSTWSE